MISTDVKANEKQYFWTDFDLKYLQSKLETYYKKGVHFSFNFCWYSIQLVDIAILLKVICYWPLRKFWPLRGWGDLYESVKTGKLRIKIFFQIMLNEFLKSCLKMYLLKSWCKTIVAAHHSWCNFLRGKYLQNLKNKKCRMGNLIGIVCHPAYCLRTGGWGVGGRWWHNGRGLICQQALHDSLIIMVVLVKEDSL